MKLEIERTEREQDQSRSQNEAKFKWKHQQEKMNRFSFFFFLCVPPWRISWVEISASWVTRNSAGQRRHHHSLVTFLSERRQVADLIPFQSSAIIYFIYLFFWILNFDLRIHSLKLCVFLFFLWFVCFAYSAKWPDGAAWREDLLLISWF